MATPTFDFYGLFFESLFEGRIDFLSDPMYCMLCSTVYPPNQDTHKFLSDVTGEIIASGYTSGGQQVTGVAAAYQVSGASKSLIVSGGNLNWPTLTMANNNSAYYGVLYMAPQGLSTTQMPLIGYLNFEQAEAPSDQAFYITWNPGGIFGIAIPAAS